MEADEGISMKTSKNMSIEVAGNIDGKATETIMETRLRVPFIHSNNGAYDNLSAKAAQMGGTFAGTLAGTATYATAAGIAQEEQPLPVFVNVEVPGATLENASVVTTTVGKTIDSICTEVTAHEPYSGHINNSPDYEGKILDIVSQPYNIRTNDYVSTIVSNQLSEVCPIPPDTSKDTTIPQMQLSEHFTLADLCYSDTAYRRKINNVPQDSEIAKLRILCEQVLEPIWSHFNKRVIVNSGYRGRALNAAVGGATTSQHCYGEAADIEIAGVSNYDLAVWVRDNIQFDQLILEYANNLSVDPNSGWVHVSYREGRLRGSVLTINNRGTRQGLIKCQK
jgi:phage tail protein X